MKILSRLFEWVSGWWTTWRVLRHADAETRAVLLDKRPFDPANFVEVERPIDAHQLAEAWHELGYAPFDEVERPGGWDEADMDEQIEQSRQARYNRNDS